MSGNNDYRLSPGYQAAFARGLEAAANIFAVPGFRVPITANVPAQIQDSPAALAAVIQDRAVALAAAPVGIERNAAVDDARRMANRLADEAVRLHRLAVEADPNGTATDARALRLVSDAADALLIAESTMAHADLLASRFRAESYAARGLLTLDQAGNAALVHPARVQVYYNQEDIGHLPQMLEAAGPGAVMLPEPPTDSRSETGASGDFWVDSYSDVDMAIDPTEDFWAELFQGL